MVDGDGTDWLMPTWSGRGANLFAMHLRQGDLDAVYGLARSASAFTQAERRLPLSGGATVDSAFQALTGRVSLPEMAGPRQDRLVLVHPARGVAVAWTPLTVRGNPIFEFDFGAGAFERRPRGLAAIFDPYPYAMVSTMDDLVRQDVTAPREYQKLLKGFLVPRPVPGNDTWSHVLLAPGQGTVGMTALRMVPIEDARQRARAE